MNDHTLELPKFSGDISNYQLVTAHAKGERDQSIIIGSPLPIMSKEQALILAAWIVAIADTSENFEEFRSVLKAVIEA